MISVMRSSLTCFFGTCSFACNCRGLGICLMEFLSLKVFSWNIKFCYFILTYFYLYIYTCTPSETNTSLLKESVTITRRDIRRNQFNFVVKHDVICLHDIPGYKQEKLLNIHVNIRLCESSLLDPICREIPSEREWDKHAVDGLSNNLTIWALSYLFTCIIIVIILDFRLQKTCITWWITLTLPIYLIY